MIIKRGRKLIEALGDISTTVELCENGGDITYEPYEENFHLRSEDKEIVLNLDEARELKKYLGRHLK